jgi:F-type H+-transporting ATPase subunit epsilon
MADKKLKLEILTPQRKILTAETAWVTIPGMVGELGILPEHLPLVTTVDSGVLQYESGGRPVKMAVHYGYATIQNDEVTVLSEMAERAEDIDVDRARRAEEKARAELKKLLESQQAEESRMRKYEAKLKRASMRESLRS